MMKQAKKFLPLRIFFKILILRRRIKTVPDEIVEDEEEGESRHTRKFRYLSVRLAHVWNRWRRKYLTDLREFHKTKASNDPRPVQIGDVVREYDESKGRGEWRLAGSSSYCESYQGKI